MGIQDEQRNDQREPEDGAGDVPPDRATLDQQTERQRQRGEDGAQRYEARGVDEHCKDYDGDTNGYGDEAEEHPQTRGDALAPAKCAVEVPPDERIHVAKYGR